MNLIACDGTWTQAGGALSCTGTLVAVDSTQLPQSGVTPEERDDLTGEAIVLFAIVFAVLALKKAL